MTIAKTFSNILAYKFFYNLLLILILFTSTVFSCFAYSAKVIRVIDGDTIVLENGDKVRLIGINAPEISDLFGEEAASHLSNLVKDKVVELESDTISSDRDRYSRLLRYVVLENRDINKQMVEDGYAFAYLKYSFSRKEGYRDAQLSAQDFQVGIWKNKHNLETDDSHISKINQSGEEKNNIIDGSTLKLLSISLFFIILILIGLYYYIKT